MVIIFAYGEEKACQHCGGLLECGMPEKDMSEAARIAREREQMESEQGWPGDGSGLDDLADYNQNEAADYANE